jgi:hypothetical protein
MNKEQKPARSIRYSCGDLERDLLLQSRRGRWVKRVVSGKPRSQNDPPQTAENRKITGVSVGPRMALFPAGMGRAEKGNILRPVMQELVDVAQGAEMEEGASK